MANVIRETNTHVTIAVRLPRGTYDTLSAAYPNHWQALRAVRLMFEDAVHLALADASAQLLRQQAMRAATDQDEEHP